MSILTINYRGIKMTKSEIENYLKTNDFIEMYTDTDSIDIIYSKTYTQKHKFFLCFNGIAIHSGATLKPIYNKLKKMNVSLYSLKLLEV